MRVNIKIPWLLKCILTLAYAYLIFAASSEDTSSIAIPRYVDKLIHFVEFGLSIGIASLYGISDEFHQSFTPHRSVDVFDWLADTAGAVAAGFLWQMSVHKLQIKEKSFAMDKTPINM
ncbi:MAG: VanZ like family protein [Candidatus Brocadiaceae bacterium]|nr:VanZ like family protein [Candidatus Brocadiaceae bacterium]